MNKILKAIVVGDWETLLKYLESNGEIDIRDKDGRSPLINAVSQKRLDIVQILIKKIQI
jgi:ankyrin repeat protein